MDPHDIANPAQPRAFVTYDKAGTQSCTGPPLGLMDIGISNDAYIFQVSLPGMRKNDCNIKCEIQRNGTVCIHGEVTAGEGAIQRSLPGAFQYRVQQLNGSGPFMLSFQLPGPVDPRLFSPKFRSDGILEGVVMKYRVPAVNLDG